MTRCKLRGQHNRWRGDCEVGPMVLTDAKDIETDLIRDLRQRDELAQSYRGVGGESGRRIRGNLAEGIEANFKGPVHDLYDDALPVCEPSSAIHSERVSSTSALMPWPPGSLSPRIEAPDSSWR